MLGLRRCCPVQWRGSASRPLVGHFPGVTFPPGAFWGASLIGAIEFSGVFLSSPLSVETFLLTCDELVDFGSIPSESSIEDSWVGAFGLGCLNVLRFPSLTLGFNLLGNLIFLDEVEEASMSSCSVVEVFLFLLAAVFVLVISYVHALVFSLSLSGVDLFTIGCLGVFEDSIVWVLKSWEGVCSCCGGASWY